MYLQEWGRMLLSWAVRARPLPHHVAFVMDGNRRFAMHNRLPKAQGHRAGYATLVDALEWCLDLGINYVTVYAFSVDNFRRPKSEVGDLMSLASDKLEELMQEREIIHRHGIQVRVIGELQLLPLSVQKAAAKVMAETAKNCGGVLNICFSYTSQNEIVTAARSVVRCVGTGELSLSDVGDDILFSSLHTSDCPRVDLLVRTSGETRLSDFLLWQASHASLEFTTVLWPEFSFHTLIALIAKFQRSQASKDVVYLFT